MLALLRSLAALLHPLHAQGSRRAARAACRRRAGTPLHLADRCRARRHAAAERAIAAVQAELLLAPLR